MTETLLDGVPAKYRIMMWEEVRRTLKDWPPDPAINVAWVNLDWDGDHITLQLSRDEAARIAAWRPDDDVWRDEIGAEPVSIAG